MRTSLACNVSPLFLRIALGITFLWAGSAKVFFVDGFSGGAAAGLANAGVQAAIDAARPAPPPPIVPAPTPEPTPAPSRPQPPAETPYDDEAFDSESNATGSRAASDLTILPAAYLAQPADAAPAGAGTTPAPAPTLRTYTAEQFPEDTPVKLRRLNGLILAMDGAHQRGQWPDFLASPQAYGALAWAAALTELFAGIFLLVGFLSRLAGLGVAGVMAGAMWMTQIGPSIGTTGAFLGFLPALQLDEAGAWVTAWKDILWQFALLMMGLAIFFSGPGKLSIDALLFSSGREARGGDDD